MAVDDDLSDARNSWISFLMDRAYFYAAQDPTGISIRHPLDPWIMASPPILGSEMI